MLKLLSSIWDVKGKLFELTKPSWGTLLGFFFYVFDSIGVRHTVYIFVILCSSVLIQSVSGFQI